MAGKPQLLYQYGKNKEKKSLREWAEQFKIPYETLYARINRLGWPMSKALSEPVRPRIVKS